eukprot:TRINITY_DN31868_c0_g1_i1.p1 TRINITY_DN31868_c0_g1~~TRINITY_DN31868_c0_g1_i1.p1  ORF type:complete len:266 (+),score=52.55 TRINITY_DN31868_c0_g1_i1:113-910(+)
MTDERRERAVAAEQVAREDVDLDGATASDTQAGMQTGTRGGCAWSLGTGSAPASARPKAAPRPPLWQASGGRFGRLGKASLADIRQRPAAGKEGNDGIAVGRFKEAQTKTLAMFRECAKDGKWAQLHRAHFDWWMFPIDDGSKPQWNIRSEADVAALRGDSAWLEGYHEALRIATLAWGWDLEQARRVQDPQPEMQWRNWDVRLSKMCRSVFLFEESDILGSLQAYARELQAHEKGGKSFFYGSICLDELLYFELPRRIPEGTAT